MVSFVYAHDYNKRGTYQTICCVCIRRFILHLENTLSCISSLICIHEPNPHRHVFFIKSYHFWYIFDSLMVMESCILLL